MDSLVNKDVCEDYEVCYSPKFSRNNPNEVIGVECQLRFKVDDGITLSANLFNEEEVVKNTGDQAFYFLLREAVRYISSEHPSLEIHISANQINIVDSDLPRYIQYIGMQNKFPTQNIVLDLSLGPKPIKSIEYAFKVNKFKEAGITVLFDPKISPVDYAKGYIRYQFSTFLFMVRSRFVHY